VHEFENARLNFSSFATNI